MNPLIEQFNRLVFRADTLTRFMLDKSSPEQLYDALRADNWPKTAEELKEAGKQLGYFNGKPKTHEN